MRLYLSSFKLGDYPEKLQSLAGTGKNAVVILNALDYKEDVRKEFLRNQTQSLIELGFLVEELDLRNYFGREKELGQFLSNKDLVWVNGGNTFILRRAMKESGFDLIISKMLDQDSIVYAGFSAGVCVLAPTLKALDITDDPNIVPAGYASEIIWDGLNIIPYSVAVHYQSDHSESSLTDKEIKFYEDNNMPYKKLRDGEVLIIDGDKEEIFK